MLGTLLIMSAAATVSADWTLVLVHSNDLWFQLDEIEGDDTVCYKPLPPVVALRNVPLQQDTFKAGKLYYFFLFYPTYTKRAFFLFIEYCIVYYFIIFVCTT